MKKTVNKQNNSVAVKSPIEETKPFIWTIEDTLDVIYYYKGGKGPRPGKNYDCKEKE